MKLLSEPLVSNESPCPYIDGKMASFSYFFATDLTAEELDTVLSRGWRKFGMYYFRPVCADCGRCIPIRIKTAELIPSKSQRRALRDCRDIRVEFKELEYRDEIYELYEDHSLNRFGKVSTPEEFRTSFYVQSCPTLQSEYYVGDKLAGAGFIDLSSNALSSIYFFYGSEFSKLRLGTFSAFKEAYYALSLGLKYYYLGYFIENNSRMAYKNSFRINEKMDWDTGTWLHQDLYMHTTYAQE